MTETKPAAEPMPPGGKIRWVRVTGAGLFALLLLAAFVLSWLVNDTERVRRTVESVVSAIGDRPFTIEGEFDFELGNIITVRAGKIRWQNSPSSSAPYMLEIEQFTGSLDLLSLFNLPIVITGAQASSATLLFEWDDDGGFNWLLATADDTKPNKSEPPNPLPLVIDKASVQNASVRFRHPALTEELEIIVRTAEHQQDEANRLVVSAVALLEGRELSIDGHIGPFPELAVAGAVNFDVAIAGQLAALAAAGNFASLAQLREPNLVAELSAPSATELAHQFKLPLETTGNVQLQVNVISEGDGIAATTGGSFGEFEVDARFRSDSLKSLQGLDAAVRSAGPSIRDVAAIAGLSDLPDTPYEFEARARRTEQGLELQSFRLDTTGLNINGSGIARAVPELRDIDLELTAAGSNLATVAELFNLDIKAQLPFQLNAAIAGNNRGQNDDIDASLQLGSTTARVTGSISEAVDFSGSRLRFTVNTPDANELARVAGVILPAGSGLQFRGSSSITAERISFDNLKASVGGAELTGTAWLERKPKQPGFNFDGQVKGPNLAYIANPLLPESARSTLPQLDFAASARLRLAAGRLDIKTASANVGKSEFGFAGQVDLAKRGMNVAGKVSARGDSLAELLSGLDADNIPDQAFSLKSRLRMSPDAIRFNEIRFTGQHVRIGGELGFTGKDYSRIEFDLTGGGDKLTDLIPESDAYRPADVPFSVATRGATDLAIIEVDRFEAQLGDARLELSGELQLQPTLAARGVRLTGSGPRLSDLGTTGMWSFTDHPFEVSASMQGSAGELLIDDLQIKSVDNNLSGGLRYLDKRVPLIEITLKSSKLNLDEIRVLNLPEDNPVETQISHGRLFTDEPLPFDVLDTFDAALNLQFDDLITRERRFRNLVAEASLKDG
ncbi:MAG: AsmA family protein, partial [Pseudomonadota bacterium]